MQLINTAEFLAPTFLKQIIKNSEILFWNRSTSDVFEAVH